MNLPRTDNATIPQLLVVVRFSMQETCHLCYSVVRGAVIIRTVFIIVRSRLFSSFYVWRTVMSRKKMFNRVLSPFLLHFLRFSINSPHLFLPPLLVLLSLESSLRFQNVDWSWYCLNLPARNWVWWNYSNSDASSAAVNICCRASVIPFMPQSMPPLMGLDLSTYIVAHPTLGTSPEMKILFAEHIGI
jgi:hypothetical protein